MTQLRHELQKCGLPPGCALHPIREKSGIVVFRAGDCVGKYFRQAHDRREIQYYELLRSLGVPTLRLIAKTERLLLLEDIAASGKYRLGTEQDMSDPNVARLIAAWFRQLHSRGKAYGGLPKLDLLDDVKDALSAKSGGVWRLQRGGKGV
ncbi:MAG: hypothetical protein FWF60_06805 [Oscillospiraceae bacterium]|nr:hypothetical protein [Oscillospiraceae bacterium]